MQQTDVKAKVFTTSVAGLLGPTRIKGISLNAGAGALVFTLYASDSGGALGAVLLQMDVAAVNSVGGNKNIYIQIPGEGIYSSTDYVLVGVSVGSLGSNTTIYYG